MKKNQLIGLVAAVAFAAIYILGASQPAMAKEDALKFGKWEALGQGFLGRKKKIDKTIALANLKEGGDSAVAAAVPVFAVWMKTGTEGLHGASITDIADALGETESNLRNKAKKKKLLLTNEGKKVRWHFNSDTDSIQFVALEYDTFYTDQNAYQLSMSKKKSRVIARSKGKAPKNSGAGIPFSEELHFEEEPSGFWLPWAVEPGEPDADYWYWSSVFPGFEFNSIIQIPDVAPSTPINIRVELRGLTDSDRTSASNQDDHHVAAYLDGVEIGSLSWDGLNVGVIEGVVNIPVVLDGLYTLNLQSTLRPSGVISFQVLNEIDVSYTRLPVAEEGQLWMHELPKGTQTVTGFTSDNITVIQSPDSVPKFITKTLIESDGAGFKVTFKTSKKSKDYLVVQDDAVLTVESQSISPDIPSRLTSKNNQADYLILSPRKFQGSSSDPGTAELLREYRSNLYPHAKIVWLDDIYEIFGFGRVDPFAVTRFMDYVDRKWKTTPTMVTVLGKGTVDEKGREGIPDSLFPAVMADTAWNIDSKYETEGLFASDDRLLAGTDVAPFAIGRIPIVTDDEGKSYVSKIQYYEASAPSISREASLIADNDDPEAGYFHANMDSMAERISNPNKSIENPNDHGFLEAGVEKLYWTLGNDLTDFQNQVRDDSAWEKDLVIYDGHGDAQGTGSERFIESAHAAALENTKLPVFAALSCIVGNFSTPGLRSFASTLVLNHREDGVLGSRFGGAIAAMVPTALSYDVDAQKIGENFVDSFYESGNNKTIGEATQNAKSTLKTSSDLSFNFMPWIFTVLGDPAIRAL